MVADEQIKGTFGERSEPSSYNEHVRQSFHLPALGEPGAPIDLAGQARGFTNIRRKTRLKTRPSKILRERRTNNLGLAPRVRRLPRGSSRHRPEP